MLKKVLIALAVVVLFVAPLAGRWIYYHSGVSQTRTVPRPDLSQVAAALPEMPAFEDAPSAATTAAGVILVDRAHDNRFAMGELNVLQARLAARGKRIEVVESAENLTRQLRDAQALAIISPGTSLSTDEIRAIKAFVDKGGRLLLAGDPTRYSVLLNDAGDYAGLDSDSSHLNDLAAEFGLVFQPDYLYNTVENEGNFRNIRLTEIATGTLTAGLEQVVFYGAHSILASDPPLIATGGETRSSSSERAGPLAVAVLTADGSVLALGDTTFMSEPYNTSYDNDRFVSNVADFLGEGQRSYDLADFPFFFRHDVDLVYAGGPALDSDLLKGGSTLQDLFEKQGRVLSVRDEEDAARDTLFFGLYDEAEDVQPYLEAGGVTLVMTPTAEAGPQAEPGADVTPVLSHTAGITLTPEISPTTGGQANVEAMGSVVLSGTAMLMLQTSGERHVLVVLATSEAGLDNAVQRLDEGKLEDCVLEETAASSETFLALCPTGEVKAGKGTGGWEQEKPPAVQPAAPAPSPGITAPATITTPVATNPAKGKIAIVALDKGKGRYDSLSDAADYAAILKSDYDVTVWSEAKQGVPALSDLDGYDLVIWAAGDFEEPLGEQESNLVVTMMVSEVPIILSGAYLNDTAKDAVQRDVQVAAADHPVMKGFKKDEVIEFVPAPSGKEYAVNIMDVSDSEGALALLTRGPGSASAGAPALVALEDELSQMRMLYVGFPLYLLPQEAKARLVQNAVGWILGK
jgi:hypothetical protein